MKAQRLLLQVPHGAGAGILPVLVVALLVLLWPSLALADGIRALFDPSTLQGGPFPSDRFTVSDPTHNTGLRVNLPKLNCVARPSDCEDVEVINELDGFNLQPRLSIPFEGRIDVATVSGGVFLVRLGSTLPGGEPGGQVIAINQIVWDTFSNTLHVESDELLDQHTRYLLVVTKDVRDEGGKRIKATDAFLNFVDDSITASTGDSGLDTYRTALRNALTQVDGTIVLRGQVVAASVFTTQSVTAILEKIRDAVKSARPAPADFLLGPGGSRTVFARSAVKAITLNKQMSAMPDDPLIPMLLPISALDLVPGKVGKIGFGKYSSLDYRVHPGEYIPAIGTLSGTPAVQRTTEVGFIVILPSSSKPTAGYPVAIVGHGSGTNKHVIGLVAAKMAEQGIATIAIDSVGSGFGPSSGYTITFTNSSSVTFTFGGRGFDQDGDGQIDDPEGFDAAPPRTVLGGRDGQRQTTVDYFQLVRVIQVGMDLDGDAVPELDPSRIYYVGSSRGGNRGFLFMALEPDVRVGVLNVSGGGFPGFAIANRGGLGASLESRMPPLTNSPGISSLDGLSVSPPFFDENLPLRDGVGVAVVLEDGATATRQSPLINTVAGAIDIQQVIENREWAAQSGDPVVYAPHIRRTPLAGVPPKSVILQFANGDRLAPNPATTALIRAGDLADRTTFVRTNLFFTVNPSLGKDSNLYPHVYLTPMPGPQAAARTAIALKAQHQVASFFASHGILVIDPDDVAPFLSVPIFEVPIVPPLPEALNYFP